MKVEQENEDLIKKLKEKVESKCKGGNYKQLIYYLINEIGNPRIHRSLIFKDLPKYSRELDINKLIFDTVGISFVGAVKNFPCVSTVLFRTSEQCDMVFNTLTKKDYYIKGRKIKVERFKATKFNLLFTHINRLKYIDKLHQDIKYEQNGYNELWYEVETLKKKLKMRANKQFELETKNAQLNEKIQGVLYNKESLKIHVEEERKKEFEKLKQECINKLQNFKV